MKQLKCNRRTIVGGKILVKKYPFGYIFTNEIIQNRKNYLFVKYYYDTFIDEYNKL